MAEVDANIPLAAGNIAANAGSQMISMFDFAQKIRDARDQIQGQNALKQIFTNPENVDPQTGLPTQKAIAGVMQVSPAFGMKLQEETLDQQAKRAQAQHAQSEAGKIKFDFMGGVAGAAYDAYADALAKGKSEEDAIAVGQAVRNETARNNGGIVGDDVVQGITGSPFDPMKAKALAGTNKEWSTAQHQERSDDLREKHDEAMESHSEAMEGIALRGLENREGGSNKWQILTDPKNQTQYRYNPETGESTSLDAKTPYSPGGAQKLGGGTTPRSMAAAAMQKYMEEHPSATDEDVTKFAMQFGSKTKSANAFSTGPQGNAVRSFNVAISHLNTLESLVDALDNGDVKVINKLGQTIAEQTGKPAPTNFDAAKAIVGDEIVKAVVGPGGGALADRENAKNQIDRANSPAQLKGVISTYKDLMGGQLKGLKKQYEDTTGLDDFDKRLSDETRSELGIDKPSQIAAPASKADYDALPSGARYSKPGDAPGSYRVKP